MEDNIPTFEGKRIVIIGGGFAGINAAKMLRKSRCQVVMIDRNNFHNFQPLLYQVASGALEPDSILFPLRKLISKYPDFHFRMADVISVHPEKNRIETTRGILSYDYLIIATGSRTNYFGVKEYEGNSLPLKTPEDAINIRHLILKNFEEALFATKIKEREALMNIAIIGAGPTGVELAGAFAELRRHVLPSDYPELDFKQMQVHLIEAAPAVLIAMGEKSQRKALQFLEKMGVMVWLNSPVKDIKNNEIMLFSGKRILASAIIWAAGVEGKPIEGIEKGIITKNGRVKVDKYLRMEKSNNIFIAGDLSFFTNQQFPKGFPMMAPVAIQQGRHCAKNILRSINNQELEEFHYVDKGAMATVGRSRAVAETSFIKSQGFIAWFLWLILHLMYLVGFRNRLVVLINWMWSYFSYDRGIRLILKLGRV